MAVVTVQIGQCGNQIGCELFSTLSKEYATDSDISRRYTFNDFNADCLDIFFDEVSQKTKSGCKYQARSILVDMETKVVDKVVTDAKRSGLWRYDNKCQILHKRGSGNNWAYGFKQAGQEVENALEEVLARQTEKCDRLSGFMMMMSLAGGTGSGVGSLMTSVIRDLYPHSVLLNQVTWPYESGEIAVQGYNLILSIANSYPHSDCLLTFQNDVVQKICQQNSSSQNVSFSDLNKHISKDISYLLSPSSSSSSPLVSFDSLNDLVRHMCSHPDYKMCRVFSPQYSPDHIHQYNTYQWPSVIKELGQHFNRSSNNYKNDLEWVLRHNERARGIDRSYAQMLLLRGKQLDQLDPETLKKQYLKIKSSYPVFNSDGFACQWHPRPMFDAEKSGLLASNDLPQMGVLDGVVDKAWRMFTSKAFVHQYIRFGLEEEDFVESFAFVEQLISNYLHL